MGNECYANAKNIIVMELEPAGAANRHTFFLSRPSQWSAGVCVFVSKVCGMYGMYGVCGMCGMYGSEACGFLSRLHRDDPMKRRELVGR